MNDINQVIEALVMFYDKGRSPSELKQMVAQRIPNTNELGQQMQNMAQGRNPKEFILQIAKQNGATERNLENLARILRAN